MVDNPPPTVETLAEDVKELKAQIDKETKGFTGWIKWLGLILAFLAAIFAVPKGAIELWDAISTRPDTQVTPESNLTMFYDPGSKMLQFDFAFTISNDGKKHDTIKNASARLERIDQPSSTPLVAFNDTDISFAENNVKVTNRFSINKETTRAITCQISSYLSDQNRETFLQQPSRWRLTIELMGEYDKTNDLKYCFDISKIIVDEIINSQERVTEPFSEAQCNGDSE